MKTILALCLLLPALSFASGSQKGMSCSIDGVKVLNIKPMNEDEASVELYENGQKIGLDCELTPAKRKLVVTCSFSDEGTTTTINIVGTRGKNKSSILRTLTSEMGEEVLEDSKMTCKKI
jgi:hypothetical protein